MTELVLELAPPFALGALAVGAALLIHRRACVARDEAEASAKRAAHAFFLAQQAADRAGECEPEEIVRRARDLHRQAQLLADQTTALAKRAEAAAGRTERARKEKRKA